MIWMDWLIWGFAATVIMTTLMTASRALGYTRIDFPIMIGSIFTPSREKSKWMGFILHMITGWAFAGLYILIFMSSGIQNIWFGMVIGLFHALFILLPGMSLLPAIHPRMVRPHHGPEPTRQLAPPGFLALHYGKSTPIVTILAHLIFGAILGFFYGRAL
jgi:uncharacterized membrane protein YagU involved in acid resistance